MLAVVDVAVPEAHEAMQRRAVDGHGVDAPEGHNVKETDDQLLGAPTPADPRGVVGSPRPRFTHVLDGRAEAAPPRARPVDARLGRAAEVGVRRDAPHRNVAQGVRCTRTLAVLLELARRAEVHEPPSRGGGVGGILDQVRRLLPERVGITPPSAHAHPDVHQGQRRGPTDVVRECIGEERPSGCTCAQAGAGRPRAVAVVAHPSRRDIDGRRCSARRREQQAGAHHQSKRDCSAGHGVALPGTPWRRG
mmetsp:Transcript_61191/g.122631  ORF Transcript_61191/g.122631 Transcript_61191/m.122631 type:complete len:249 (+) Transcript_61191:452-1198(+)